MHNGITGGIKSQRFSEIENLGIYKDKNL